MDQHSTEENVNHIQLPFPLGQSVDETTLQLVTQGAEALLYRTVYLQPSLPCALKYRPPKSYRHPTLDARLTRHRVLAEARVLVRCRRAGVLVPAVYHVDWERGWLMMEWIEGASVKYVLHEHLRRSSGDFTKDVELRELMTRIGQVVGDMHAAGVVHGDLTTSNLMLRPQEERIEASSGDGLLKGDVVLIDFGLAAQTIQDEDRAVDLYVLERAFGSTHPTIESLFGVVLESYATSFKGARQTLKRLEEVRLRGRKKSMIG
ncbi:MAG: hypothetical protein M1823_003946 [Watsoniomyces obsoletus]|nr:MAG: hypothetical protein M1823_003946 [Watsoniomyces obsoletus]